MNVNVNVIVNVNVNVFVVEMFTVFMRGTAA
jgi:hypothetical protein